MSGVRGGLDRSAAMPEVETAESRAAGEEETVLPAEKCLEHLLLEGREPATNRQ